MKYNLKAEMVRANITSGDIAKLLDLHVSSVSNKISGKSKFTIDEAFTIRNSFFPDCDYETLFKDNSPCNKSA